MKILDTIVGALAEFLHPGMPREGVLGRFVLPTDLSPDEAKRRFKAEASKRGLDFNSAHDLVKLSSLLRGRSEEQADEDASLENRTLLARELGRPTYTGTIADNELLRKELFKAAEQRGIPLPTAD